MLMDGVYETSINTPMGNINARIALKQMGNLINGMVEVMGSKNPLSEGKVNGNKCYFSGEIKNNMLSLKYDITGELIGNTLNIYAKTNMGEFKLQAKKVG